MRYIRPIWPAYDHEKVAGVGRSWSSRTASGPERNSSGAGCCWSLMISRNRMGTIVGFSSRRPDLDAMVSDRGEQQAAAPSLNVQRLGTGHLAGGVGGDLLDPCLRLPQQFLAAPLERLAAFVNGDGFLQRYLAILQSLHDRFKFLKRPFEA